MTFDPIKDGNTKHYRCVDLTMMHICEKLEYFHKKFYHGNDDSTHTKNDWRLRFTITHLHAKFEDDPRSGKNCRS